MSGNKICRRVGERTFEYSGRPSVTGAGSVAGEMEGQGPQAEWFDVVLKDDRMGQETWEKAESKMFQTAVEYAMRDAGISRRDADAILCGDLLNQLMASSFMARDLAIPFLVVSDGACSTMTESMLLARYSCGRRILQNSHNGSFQPLFHGGTPVSHAAGTWKSESLVGSVDSYSGGGTGDFIGT